MITSSRFLPNTLIISADMSSRKASHTSVRWVFDCSQWTLTPTIWFKCLKSIQPEERERINRFVFQNDAISSMVGRLLMRKLAVESSRHVTWRDVKLGRSENGKPYVKNRADVVMNVSHHGRMTVLAAEVFHWRREKGEAEWRRARGSEEGEDRGNAVKTVEGQSKGLNKDGHDACHAKSERRLETGNISDSKQFQTKNQCVHVEEQTNVDNQNVELSETMINADTKNYCAPQDLNFHMDNQVTKRGDQMLENSTYVDGQGPGYSLQLGVDVCKRDLPRNTPVPNFFRIMRRNFHPAEWDYILAVPGEHDQLGRFYRMWSLKESFVKATGTGITVPLAEMCFVPASEPLPGHCVYDTRVRVQDEERREWLFEETLLEGGYCVAVALRREGTGVDESCEDETGVVADNRVFCVDKVYEMIRFDDFEPLMPDDVADDDEEVFYEAQDFMKKQLRPWDS
uniref:L-aminoadipate-semialdehyde dehydrogenase-phosphopantetheinyl transferase n=1 Tax=Cacopsylla melanoneura TaxID=428564 RepID=A0A8D8LPJ0_9HEMI